MNETPPPSHDFSQIKRFVLADKPRVTRYKIPWGTTSGVSQVKTNGGVNGGESLANPVDSMQ